MSKKEPLKDVKTEVQVELYKGSPVFSIHQVNDKGERGQFSQLIGFGKKKALAIVRHIEEIKKFSEE